MRVLKFGGKSLNSKEKFIKLCRFIKNIYKTENQIIVVVSAIGSTTDNLINTATEYGYMSSDKNIHSSKFELARLLSTGEIQSASLFSIMLNSMGVPAKSFSGREIELLTFGDCLNGKIAYINKSKLSCHLNQGVVCVVAGFQGVNNENEITTHQNLLDAAKTLLGIS